MQILNKIPLSVLPILSGLLLGVSWPSTGGLWPFAFVAIVPLLLFIERCDKQSVNPFKVWFGIVGALVVWNLITTYWLYHVQGGLDTKITSFVLPILLNSLFKSFPVWLYKIGSKHFNAFQSYVALIVYWIGYEYFALDWDLSWPWLQLGNLFSDVPQIIQWYEYVGVHGGSLWVLSINLMLFDAIRKRGITTEWWRPLVIASLLLVFPITNSLFTYYGHEDQGEVTSVAVVQPNLDPYSVKFNSSALDQLNDMIAQGVEVGLDDVSFLIFPETALQERTYLEEDIQGGYKLSGLWENQLEDSYSIKILKELVKKYPNLTVLAGMSSDSLIYDANEKEYFSRPIGGTNLWYNSYNSALAINKNYVEWYHKSKLVPAAEILPFARFFPFMKALALDLGGTTGELGRQENREVYREVGEDAVVAPVICYESVYGEFVGEYVKAGANFIGIVTNDGWWSFSPGHKQHFAYARLRAIESRRTVVRSANTGISGVINQRGEIVKTIPYWEKGAFRADIQLNNKPTFYATYGDIIGRNALFLAGLMFVYAFAIKAKKKMM